MPQAWPLKNVWLGASIENQQTADQRIPHLLRCPAAVRFLSIEPLLGPVDLSTWIPEHPGMASMAEIEAWESRRLHWVIVGGESGPHARPMHPAWVRGVRDQCQAAGVPFFFKQWGEWCPSDCDNPQHYGRDEIYLDRAGRVARTASPFDGNPCDAGPCDASMVRVGKKAAGRTLDGRTWDEMPEVKKP